MVAEGGGGGCGVDAGVVSRLTCTFEGAGQFRQFSCQLVEFGAGGCDLRGVLHGARRTGTQADPPGPDEDAVECDGSQSRVGVHQGARGCEVGGESDVNKQPGERSLH